MQSLSKIETIKERYTAYKNQNPHARIRNAAAELGVSEAELLATGLGENVILLRPEFQAILAKIENLGKVMALTRNDDVVHERKGIYLNPTLDSPHMGLFVGADIDLRIFFGPWKLAFAVTEGEAEKQRKSLQFFGADGEAVHKIYLVPQSNEEAYENLVAEFKSPVQDFEFNPEPAPAPRPEMPDHAVDIAGFRTDWENLKDTHDFYGLLGKYRISRTQALRLAPEGNYAVKVGNDALRKLITRAAETETPIMVFVGNRGMIQIHTGPVKKLMDHEGWFNVLDPDFNLHIRENSIAECWVVRKPTTDGMVTALECFDSKGNQIIQLFGKRKPGIPELESWRNLVAEIG